MAVARFFERNYAAVGAALSISRDALERTLAARTIGLLCGPDVEGDANARWTAEMTVALLARLYPRLSLEAPPALADALTTLAVAINPLVEIVRGDDVETAIVIGGRRSPLPPNAIFAGARGWVAHVARTPVPAGGPENPYSAGAAGCIAVGEVFRHVFRASLRPWVEPRDLAFSLLDYGRDAGASLPVPDVDLSEVAFFGLGAVANGALWALGRHRALRGITWLVDAETVDLSNLQRYVLTLDVDEGRSKPALAAEALRGTGIEPRPRASELEEFAEGYPAGFSIPTVCVSTDDVPARRATQALLPRTVLNGFTGDRSLGTSWHRFSDDAACLACLYHPDHPGKDHTQIVGERLGLGRQRASLLWATRAPLPDQDLRTIADHLGASVADLAPWRGRALHDLYSDVVCGSVALDVRGIGRLETVPLAHQSALAGVLMAAELVKRSHPELETVSQPERLVSWDDVLRPPPPAGRWAHRRSRAPGCFCSDRDYQAAYRRKWLVAR